MLRSDPLHERRRAERLDRLYQWHAWRAHCFDEAVIHFGQTFEGMLHECASDTESRTERARISLMQRVFGEEHAPKKQYTSMRSMFEKAGLGPGGKLKREDVGGE